MTKECSCDTAKESFTQLERDVNIYWAVGGMTICKEKGGGKGWEGVGRVLRMSGRVGGGS